MNSTLDPRWWIAVLSLDAVAAAVFVVVGVLGDAGGFAVAAIFLVAGAAAWMRLRSARSHQRNRQEMRAARERRSREAKRD